MTYNEIRRDSAICTYITQADASLAALGFTEHSFAHVTTAAHRVEYILSTLGYSEREVELGKIAAFSTTSAISSTAPSTASPAQ